jgi:molybdopterin/thiamine biosynthesis adenylyltransferase
MKTKKVKPVFSHNLPGKQNKRLINLFDAQIEELLVIRNPHLKNLTSRRNLPEYKKLLRAIVKSKVFIYYPWNQTIFSSVPEDIFFEIKTNRNREIISAKESMAYRNIKVGIGGASIGFNVLCALTLTGGAKHIKIADRDVIELSNLNRLPASVLSIGKNKALVAAQSVLESNPFLDVEIYEDGLTKKNLPAFLEKPRIDVYVDELDDIAMKVITRRICRSLRIPVLMVTNIGENVVLDVERYDLEPRRPLMHGLIPESLDGSKIKSGTQEWVGLAKKILDGVKLGERINNSLALVGSKIVGAPQLGSTAMISGSIASMAIRKIAVGTKLKSGRYYFDMASNFSRKR